VPQLATVREVPQLSGAVSGPQATTLVLQNAAFDSEVQPQWPGEPPPPQVSDALQIPQLATVRVLLQLSVPVAPPQRIP
jgi:hypothetical protein